jgi:microcompartment protein CcmL/EutN
VAGASVSHKLIGRPREKVKSVVSRASDGTVSRHAPNIALFLAARAEYRIPSSS